MRALLVILGICLAFAAAAPKNPDRVVGGSLTTINQYPSIAGLLYSWNLSTWAQTCGGATLTIRFVLTAAQCPYGDTANRWRIRVGSSWANSGGNLHNVNTFVVHPNFNANTYENDIAIIRSNTNIIFVDHIVQSASLAGENYEIPDNQVAWAVGWGATAHGDLPSEQLRHVHVWTINQETCTQRFATLGWPVYDNMLCSGHLGVGGRDFCHGDTGSPLYHNNVVVGICSWGYECGDPNFPRVNTRVSSFADWIQANT